MILLDYLKGLRPDARRDFARRCDTSLEYLMQIGYGRRSPKVDLAVTISRESGGVVTCEELLPEVDWAYLRASGEPQITSHSNTPTAAAQAAGTTTA